MFQSLRDGKRVQNAKQTLDDVVAGKKVSKKRLKEAQELFLELLEKINAQRPTRPIRCGGKVG